MKNLERAVTPKEIALYASINQETAKGIMRKLHREGKVKLENNNRGYYELVENQYHGIFNFKFQNCVLTCPLPGLNQDLGPITSEFYSLIKTSTSFYKNTASATMHVSSDYSIDLPALLTVVDNFVKQIKISSGIDLTTLDNISISSIEFNKDYSNFRLDGPNCITLTSLISQYKLYQKPNNKVREEFKTITSIDFNVLRQLLLSTSQHADLMSQVSTQSEEITQIKKDLRSIKELAFRIVAKENKNPSAKSSHIVDKKADFSEVDY